ncbi:MAG: LUD domain-containing protein [Sphingomonadaceae bacterium]
MAQSPSRRLLVLIALSLALLVASVARLQRRRHVEAASSLETREPFETRYERALASAQLRENLARYQRTWRRQRDTSFATHEARTGRQFEAMRHEMAAVKDRVIADLPAYFRQFKEAAERAGAVVHRAEEPEDVHRYILDLARRHGVDLILKSKSMVSEEIHLNAALERHGLRVVETDLGEYVAQLAHEHPSHMISPIAHKNRYEVARLLSRESGREVSGEDISELTSVARQRLRGAFLAGQMGISGANALIAESGTVMLVTNEGNGRLVSSLPPVHVVIAGYEKLLPTFSDAMAELRLLARSGTGQALTSYTTFLTGPDRPGRELHIILLDNGRSEMRADPDFVDALRCIRCGACANVCPPYRVMGGHAFGHVYAGAIGLVVTPFHHGLENGAGPQSLCVSCNACATVCPVEIPLPRQILDVRRKVADSRGLPWYKQAALGLWSRPALFDTATRVASRLQAPLSSGGLMKRLPLPDSVAWRTPPALAAKPARDLLSGRVPQPAREGPLAGSAARGLRVAYFIQCVTDRFLPEMAEATVRVIEACGAGVVVPGEQHCCGLPAFDAGDRKRALAMAKQTVRMLEGVDADYVVTGAASCVAMMVHDYPHLFADDPEWLERALEAGKKVVDLTTFLHRVAQLPQGALDTGPFPPVTYHHFCQSHNVLQIWEEPYRLISEVLGLELREMEEADSCCGFGGSFSADHPRISRHIVERKLANIDATGAPMVITDNPGCILHLRGSADASGRPLRVLHLAELVDARLRQAGWARA